MNLEEEVALLTRQRELYIEAHKYPVTTALKWMARAQLLSEALVRISEGDDDAVFIARAALYEYNRG